MEVFLGIEAQTQFQFQILLFFPWRLEKRFSRENFPYSLVSRQLKQCGIYILHWIDWPSRNFTITAVYSTRKKKTMFENPTSKQQIVLILSACFMWLLERFHSLPAESWTDDNSSDRVNVRWWGGFFKVERRTAIRWIEKLISERSFETSYQSDWNECVSINLFMRLNWFFCIVTLMLTSVIICNHYWLILLTYSTYLQYFKSERQELLC